MPCNLEQFSQAKTQRLLQPLGLVVRGSHVRHFYFQNSL